MNNIIGILDYGVGNTRSVQNMLWKLDIPSKLIDNESQLKSVDKIILPGVGSFDVAMNNLNSKNLIEAIKSFSENGYILGICLGMQVLGSYSEEGKLPGLNLIGGSIVKFDDSKVSVPHIGWNFVNYRGILENLQNNEAQRYFFVHSYHFKCDKDENIFGTTDYQGGFTSVVSNGENIFGSQFHPEKSHYFGKNFLSFFSNLK
jgi:glutamine amidotransferase